MSVADHTTPTPGVRANIEDLSTFFSKIITSKHNQHAIIMFVGSAGKGKSWAAVALARSVAERVAEKLGGSPEDYFNFKDTFATISKDEVKRVMTKPKKHAILLLDDVAAKAMNARNYKDADNIDFNSELTTFRPNHNLVIMTTQAGFLLDKVPRSLSHYIIEMEQAYFDQGFTVAKVKQVSYNHSAQKIMFPYIQSGAQKFVRHLFYAPPSDIMDEYERMRAEQLERANTDNQPDEMDKEAKARGKGITTFATPVIFKLTEKYPGITQTEIANKCREIGIEISQQSVGKVLAGYTYG